MNIRKYCSMIPVILILVGCASSSSHTSASYQPKSTLIEGVPIGWSGTSSEPKQSTSGIDQSNVHSGDASFSFLNKSGDHMTQYKQVIEAGQYAGKKVRFQANVRTDGVGDSAGLWMRADSKFRGAVAFDNMSKRRISGTNDWEQYTIILAIPENALVIHYGLLLEGKGQVWIDDCSLEIVDDDTRVTSMMGKSFSKKFVAPSGVLKYPANLQFELKYNGQP